MVVTLVKDTTSVLDNPLFIEDKKLTYFYYSSVICNKYGIFFVNFEGINNKFWYYELTYNCLGWNEISTNNSSN